MSQPFALRVRSQMAALSKKHASRASFLKSLSPGAMGRSQPLTLRWPLLSPCLQAHPFSTLQLLLPSLNISSSSFS